MTWRNLLIKVDEFSKALGEKTSKKSIRTWTEEKQGKRIWMNLRNCGPTKEIILYTNYFPQ